MGRPPYAQDGEGALDDPAALAGRRGDLHTATVAGYAIADAATGDLQAAIDGFAAGALLVMLIDSMIPDARDDAGRAAGLVTVLGFALAAGLSAS